MLDSAEHRNQNGTIAIRLPSTPHWATTSEVMALLHVSIDTVKGEDFREVVRHQSRARNGEHSRSSGWMWFRADVMELLRIRRACRLSTRSAARVMLAYREGRLDAKP